MSKEEQSSRIQIWISIIIIAILLLVLFSFKGITIDSSWASVYITTVLAIIAFWQMMEARKFRLEAVKPAFSLQPSYFIIGGDFLTLDLINSGDVARDVKVDVLCEKKIENSLFITSIGKDERVSGLINKTGEYKAKGSRVDVDIIYKDSYGKRHQDNITFDFNVLKEGRKIPYVSSSQWLMAERLDRLVERLDRLESELKKH